MAGIVAASEPSLASFAPNGPSGSTDSTIMHSTSGDSVAEGDLYSSIPGFISSPSFHTISSCIAWPSPIHTEPITWPSTDTGFSARPQSSAAQTLWTLTSPVSSSTVPSATCAEYEYAGDGPTPAPLNAPPRASLGGAYDPVPVSAPVKSMAETTASSKLILFFGPSSLRFCCNDPLSVWPSTRPETSFTLPPGASAFASRSLPVPLVAGSAVPRFHTRSSRINTSSAAQLIFTAAAATIFFFTSCAARSEALPFIKVTRLEYEPTSICVKSGSAAMIPIRPRPMPSTSATIYATIVSDPCPMSDAPAYTTTPPPPSILVFTVESRI